MKLAKLHAIIINMKERAREKEMNGTCWYENDWCVHIVMSDVGVVHNIQNTLFHIKYGRAQPHFLLSCHVPCLMHVLICSCSVLLIDTLIDKIKSIDISHCHRHWHRVTWSASFKFSIQYRQQSAAVSLCFIISSYQNIFWGDRIDPGSHLYRFSFQSRSIVCACQKLLNLINRAMVKQSMHTLYKWRTEWSVFAPIFKRKHMQLFINSVFYPFYTCFKRFCFVVAVVCSFFCNGFRIGHTKRCSLNLAQVRTKRYRTILHLPNLNILLWWNGISIRITLHWAACTIPTSSCTFKVIRTHTHTYTIVKLIYFV